MNQRAGLQDAKAVAHSGQQATLAFSKLVGAGNDFIFLDARVSWPGAFTSVNRSNLARLICARHTGIGADGMVCVEEKKGKLRWDFYNSDGSIAEMCGNATRCMGVWMKHTLGKSSGEFQTRSGLVSVVVGETETVSTLSFVAPKLQPLKFNLGGHDYSAELVDTGVPHAVIVVEDLQQRAELLPLARSLRFHPDAGERGANVTFLRRPINHNFETVTFERGVEDFTLSCGTGVLAAAAVGLKMVGGNFARLKTPGGVLSVEFGNDFKGATLAGPAEYVFSGNLNDEILLLNKG